MKKRFDPLKTSMFVAGIIGFFISVIWLPKLDPTLTWPVTFTIIFVIMILASILSMKYARPDTQLPK